jgi:hypothetical protein
MRTFILTLVSTLAAVISLHAQQTIFFRDLPPGDRLVVRMVSGGCYFFDSYELTFTHDSDYTVLIAAIEPDRSSDATGSDTRIILGHLTLTPSEIESLDDFFALCRDNPRQFHGTDFDRVRIAQMRNGTPVATEYFDVVDRKGFADPRATTPLGLVARVEEEK